MQNQLSAVTAARGEEPGDLEALAERRAAEPAGLVAQRLDRDLELETPLAAGLDHVALMAQLRFADRHAGRGVANCVALDQDAGQAQLIPCQVRQAASAGAAAGAASPPISDLDFSSFIIGDGVVTACFIFIVR